MPGKIRGISERASSSELIDASTDYHLLSLTSSGKESLNLPVIFKALNTIIFEQASFEISIAVVEFKNRDTYLCAERSFAFTRGSSAW